MKRLKAFLYPHAQYWRYLLRHKWFVFQAGLVLHVPVWRLVIHDWSKFLPAEWIPYVQFFYGPRQPKPFRAPDVEAWERELYRARLVENAFDQAWLHHIHRGPHHWQHWLLHNDDGTVVALMMPPTFVHEMVADWVGAGLAQGFSDVNGWYVRNREKMTLHPATRLQVETLLTLFRQAVEEKQAHRVAV